VRQGWHDGCVWPEPMRLAVLGTAALGFACSAAARTPEPRDENPTYALRVAELRGALGEIPMEVETVGAAVAIKSTACFEQPRELVLDGETVTLNQRSCYRCDLASDRDPGGIDPEVIDAIRIAFARYPTSFLRASNIQRIALCRVIEREDAPPGTAPERVGGTIDLETHRILFSLSAFIGSDYDPSDPFTGEDVLHHELFHLLEIALTPDEVIDDPEWRLLNAIDFAYRGHDAEQQTGLPGFVNDYATTNEIEDRASTFQYMMARPAELCAMAAKDPVIAAKAKLIWNRVATAVGDELLRRRVDCLTYRPEEPDETLRVDLRPRNAHR
jgi:hypothetical protein